MVLFLFFSVICQIKFTHSNFFKNNNYLVYHSFCGSDIWVSEVVAFKLLVELESSYGLTGRICFSAYLWSLVAALGKSAILFSMTTASLNRNNWALFSILPEKKKIHMLEFITDTTVYLFRCLFLNLFLLATFWLLVHPIGQRMISGSLILCFKKTFAFLT